MAKKLLLRELEASRDAQVRLLQQFVRAASPNPPGTTVAAASVLTDFLDSQDIPYELLDPQGNGQPNIVSEFAGEAGAGPRVVLNGHMDVFPVGDDESGWLRDPWSGAVEGDRLHGRGVVDMKSGTASLVLAYAALYAQRAHLRGSVALCAVSDEETGGRWGTKFLLTQGPLPDLMLSAEPGGCGSIRFSEKGTLRLTCTLHTRGGHGAYTNLSEGAVRAAAHFIGDVVPAVEALPVALPPDLARQMRCPDVRRRVDDTMGPGTAAVIARPTVNVGTIHGGLKVNMIPDACALQLDIRMPVGLVRDQVMAVLEGFAARFKKQNVTIDLAVHEVASNPASISSLDHPVVALLADNAHQLDPDADRPLAIPSMGATDCKHYRYAGVPAFVYGCSPTTMAQVNESASIREFLHVTKVHAAAVWDLLQ